MRSLLMILCVVSFMGCSPTWFQDFKTNPVKQTDTVLATVTSIEAVAVVAFGQLKVELPVDQQAVSQAKFDQAIVALNTAMDAVRTAVKAAADAEEAQPDFSKVIADVVAAVGQVQGVVEDVRVLLKAQAVPSGNMSTAALAAPDPAGYSEMNRMAASLSPQQ